MKHTFFFFHFQVFSFLCSNRFYHNVYDLILKIDLSKVLIKTGIAIIYGEKSTDGYNNKPDLSLRTITFFIS